MITGLDHVAVSVGDLEAATDAYRRLLGREPRRSDGEAWFQLPNMALRLVPGGGDEISALAFAVADLDAARSLASRRGLQADGPLLGDTGGIPILLVAERDPVETGAAPDAVSELDHVVIHTANPDRALAVYGAKLGLDLRLDRSNAQWGVRQLFFRCGTAVVEFGASLKTPVSDDPDRFGGLAWRVLDADAAHARIAAAGFDVSEVRTGRKPGTRVFTVRSGVPAAPALVIEQGATP